jgi:hypothetical protein
MDRKSPPIAKEDGYELVRRISTDKRACGHYWIRSRIVGYTEAIDRLYATTTSVSAHQDTPR